MWVGGKNPARIVQIFVQILVGFFHLSIPRITLQSSGVVLLFAFVHLISAAVSNMLLALLPTVQVRFALSETVLAMLAT